MIQITRTSPNGPRVHIAGIRVHHGAVGLLLAIIGAALVASDWHDIPWTH